MHPLTGSKCIHCALHPEDAHKMADLFISNTIIGLVQDVYGILIPITIHKDYLLM